MSVRSLDGRLHFTVTNPTTSHIFEEMRLFQCSGSELPIFCSWTHFSNLKMFKICGVTLLKSQR